MYIIRPKRSRILSEDVERLQRRSHHTNWVDIKIDGKPYQRREFSVWKRPDAENFTREVTCKLTEPITIVAEANCNIHGSQGPKEWTVALAPEENEPWVWEVFPSF